MNHSSIVVNHRICLPGTQAHSAASGYHLNYIATRQGVETSPTEDDILKQEQQAKLATLGYMAHRPGVVYDENSNCSLFDQNGVADFDRVRKELKENEGAIIKSVFSIRREDAKELGIETKRDFERLLRAHWRDSIAQTGAIKPENVRWVAAMHTNQPNNLHCHVITYDACGQFNCLLPRRQMEAARRDLVWKATENARQTVSLERTRMRDELREHMRADGLTRKQALTAREIAQSLPKQGSLKYRALQKSNPELIARVDKLVQDRIQANPECQQKLQSFHRAVEKHADYKGLTGKPRETHIHAAEKDLMTRLGNAQLQQIRELSQTAPAQEPGGSIEFNATNLAMQIAQAIGSGSPYRQQPHHHGPKLVHHDAHKHKERLSPKGTSRKKGLTL